jgi:hypothetical protein
VFSLTDLQNQRRFFISCGMNGLSKARLGGIISVLATQVLASDSLGNNGYLQSVGPPPMRFEAVATNDSWFLSKLALPKPKAAVPSNNAAPATEPTNAAEVVRDANPERAVPAKTKQVPVVAVTKVKENSTNSTPSASDMLTITPQMINEYFKPAPAEAAGSPTNSLPPGATIFVPAELQFVPPTLSVPSTGSRAIYQSQ